MPDRPEVLFICIHNAGRSQIAAALLHHHAAGSVTVRSAGSAPVNEINPAVVQVRAEAVLDIAQKLPKLLTNKSVQQIRPSRDDLDRRVTALLADLVTAST